MSFFSRIFRGGRKESATARLITAPGQTGPIWPPRKYDAFAKETYLKNIIAFGCIITRARAVASVEWELLRRISADEQELVDDHWMVDILKRPNPSESFAYVMLKAEAFLVLSGNGFFERVALQSGPKKGLVKELYSHRPDRMKILPNAATGGVGGYQYTVSGRKTTWEVDPITGHCDLLHLKTFHPLDDWWGASVTESAAREIDTSNAATDWNKSLLDNQARPGMVYTLIGHIGHEYFEELERALREDHSGGPNAGKNIIISGEKGTSAQPYTFSPSDMDYINLNRETARRISYGYGVPSILLGIPGDTIYNTYREARLDFWETTVTWDLNYFRGELNNWLFTKERPEDKDIFLNYNLDKVSALAPRREALWKRAQDSEFMSLDEKRNMVGLGKYEPTDDPGSMIFIEASKIPIGGSVEEEETEEEVEKRVAEEEEQAIQDLMDDGYSREEAEEMVGLPTGNSGDLKDVKDLPSGCVPDEGKPYSGEFS